MAARAAVAGMVLVLAVGMFVYLAEYFLPLSVKADMDIICRQALLRMENTGTLSGSDKEALKAELEKLGLMNVVVASPSGAKQGGLLTLRVEADYICNRTISLFKRGNVKIHMIYDRTTMSRKVAN